MKNIFKITVFVALVTNSCFAQLPNQPKPSHAWLILSAGLAAAHAADGLTTVQAQDRGAIEGDQLEYGVHPSRMRVVAVQSAYFAGESWLLWETEHTHRRALKWGIRVLAASVIAMHVDLAVRNDRVCRNGLCLQTFSQNSTSAPLKGE